MGLGFRLLEFRVEGLGFQGLWLVVGDSKVYGLAFLFGGSWGLIGKDMSTLFGWYVLNK